MEAADLLDIFIYFDEISNAKQIYAAKKEAVKPKPPPAPKKQDEPTPNNSKKKTEIIIQEEPVLMTSLQRIPEYSNCSLH